jgi:hypothetical protein
VFTPNAMRVAVRPIDHVGRFQVVPKHRFAAIFGHLASFIDSAEERREVKNNFFVNCAQGSLLSGPHPYPWRGTISLWTVNGRHPQRGHLNYLKLQVLFSARLCPKNRCKNA